MGETAAISPKISLKDTAVVGQHRNLKDGSRLQQLYEVTKVQHGPHLSCIPSIPVPLCRSVMPYMPVTGSDPEVRSFCAA